MQTGCMAAPPDYYSQVIARDCIALHIRMSTLPAASSAALNHPEGKNPAPISTGEFALLNEMRAAHLHCRSAARTNLFDACVLPSQDNDRLRAACLEGLLKGLPQATGKSLRLLRPGERDVTFDETWLLRLVGTAASDNDSFTFLLKSRVAPWAQRSVAFLARSLTEQGNAD